jgi:hypothetical protein
MKEADFNFSGRPDGLGNRIEEIISLEAFCERHHESALYVWNNKYARRSYGILLEASNIRISGERNPNLPDKTFLDLHKDFAQADFLAAARSIRPLFDVHFEGFEMPVGVHIRGTDRIGSNHSHYMKDEREFALFLSKTIDLLNRTKPKFVFICSDNEIYKNILREILNPEIVLVEPICEAGIPGEYRDFFALSLCREIYMCTKFSSFSITASLIGNIPLISYVYDKDVAERYKAVFRYEKDFDGIDESLVYARLKQKERISAGYWLALARKRINRLLGIFR